MRIAAFIVSISIITGCLGSSATPTLPVAVKGEKSTEADKKTEGEKTTSATTNGDKKDPEPREEGDPVAIAKLMAYLPKAPKGYKAGPTSSEEIKFEASVSSGEEPYTIKYNYVEGKYASGEKSLTVQVLDTNKTESLLKWVAESATLKEESDARFKKGLKIDGDPAIEEWRKSDDRRRLTVMVNGRFQIEITAFEGTPEFLREVLSSIDRKALGKLK